MFQVPELFRFGTICIHIMRLSGAWDSSLNTKFIYVSCNILYTKPENHFMQYFYHCRVWNFPLVMSCQCSKGFRFWIFRYLTYIVKYVYIIIIVFATKTKNLSGSEMIHMLICFTRITLLQYVFNSIMLYTLNVYNDIYFSKKKKGGDLT
jgi:hypothetical protein